MHKAIQAHNTPHTIVQQSAGGTHTASTGTGIEGAGLIGYAREPRTRNCETEGLKIVVWGGNDL